VWARQSWRTEKLEKHLPRIPEAFEDDLHNDIPSNEDPLLQNAESFNRIEERLAEMLSALAAKTGNAETHLVEAVGEATARVTRTW
jgi:glutathionylspermidine synthase